jgi:hypothetical protein
MTAKGALIIHVTLFLLLIIGSLLFSFLILFFPNLINKAIFLTVALILGGVFVVSNMILGSCIFTIWERKLAEKEKVGSGYTGSCIVHYAEEWFDLKLSQRASDIIPMFFFLLPIIIMLIK